MKTIEKTNMKCDDCGIDIVNIFGGKKNKVYMTNMGYGINYPKGKTTKKEETSIMNKLRTIFRIQHVRDNRVVLCCCCYWKRRKIASSIPRGREVRSAYKLGKCKNMDCKNIKFIREAEL